MLFGLTDYLPEAVLTVGDNLEFLIRILVVELFGLSLIHISIGVGLLQGVLNALDVGYAAVVEGGAEALSYTHLDVYKRQGQHQPGHSSLHSVLSIRHNGGKRADLLRQLPQVGVDLLRFQSAVCHHPGICQQAVAF